MIYDMNHWDKRFFGLCEHISNWSGDTSRKVGSVIVGPDNEIRSTGYNDHPRKVMSTQKRRSKIDGVKYLFTEHAERNAIYNAARMGIGLKGTKIYTTLFPCADCTRGIIQSGIAELHTFSYPEFDHYSESFKAAEEMLNESDTKIYLHKL